MARCRGRALPLPRILLLALRPSPGGPAEGLTPRLDAQGLSPVPLQCAFLERQSSSCTSKPSSILVPYSPLGRQGSSFVSRQCLQEHFCAARDSPEQRHFSISEGCRGTRHVSIGESWGAACRRGCRVSPSAMAQQQQHGARGALLLGQSMRCFSGDSSSASEASEKVECVVVGAGVVGLAIARQLAQAGKEVLVLEAEPAFGMGTSSRNSEVIHAGFYYDTGSLKAWLCVEGRRALYDYCKTRGIGHKNLGKLVVATSEDQLPKLKALEARGAANGVEGLRLISIADARSMEPNVHCVAALHSATTGIVDSHGFMAALQAEAEESGAMFAFNAPVLGIRPAPGGTFHVSAGEWPAADQGPSSPVHLPEPSLTIESRLVINSAGLAAIPLAHHTAGLPWHAIPKRFLAKGNYFSLANAKPPQPFSRLIYPLPEDGGIGVHVTLDLAGGVKFGPDVQWIADALDDDLYTRFDYSVDLSRAERFYGEIRKYYPDLPDGSLQADYAGMRPKVSGPGQPAADFIIRHEEAHGLKGLVNLFGIESPGLTCALAIGQHVHSLLKAADM